MEANDVGSSLETPAGLFLMSRSVSHSSAPNLGQPRGTGSIFDRSAHFVAYKWLAFRRQATRYFRGNWMLCGEGELEPFRRQTHSAENKILLECGLRLLLAWRDAIASSRTALIERVIRTPVNKRVHRVAHCCEFDASSKSMRRLPARRVGMRRRRWRCRVTQCQAWKLLLKAFPLRGRAFHETQSLWKPNHPPDVFVLWLSWVMTPLQSCTALRNDFAC